MYRNKTSILFANIIFNGRSDTIKVLKWLLYKVQTGYLENLYRRCTGLSFNGARNLRFPFLGYSNLRWRDLLRLNIFGVQRL